MTPSPSFLKESCLCESVCKYCKRKKDINSFSIRSTIYMKKKETIVIFMKKETITMLIMAVIIIMGCCAGCCVCVGAISGKYKGRDVQKKED